MFRIWAGVDIGKEHHHCVALDARGEPRLSRRVSNDELELLGLIREVLALADQGEVLWAVDTNHGSAALLIGLLLERGQPMAHLTGLAVHRASAGYRGQGKTDAKDAHVRHEVDRVRLPVPRVVVPAGREGLLAELLQIDAAHPVMDPVQNPQLRREPHPDGLFGLVDLRVGGARPQQAVRQRRMLAQPRSEKFPRPLDSLQP